MLLSKSLKPSSHFLNFLATGAIQFLEAAIPAVIAIVIARQYGLEELGFYSVAIATANLIPMVCGAGVSNAICFKIAQFESTKVHSEIFMCGFALWCLGLLLISSATAFSACALAFDTSLTVLTILFALGTTARSLGRLFGAVFRGRREVYRTIRPTLLALGSTAVVVLPMLFFKWSIFYVATGWSICQIIFLFVMAYEVLHRKVLQLTGSFSRPLFKEILGQAIPLTAEVIVFRAGPLILVVLLPYFLSRQDIGIYNAALKPLLLAVLPNECTIQFFLPYVASAKNMSNEALVASLQNLHKLSFFFTCAVFTFIYFFSSEIASTLYGVDTGPIVFPWLKVLAIIFFIYYCPPYAGALKALEKSKSSLLCAVVQFVILLSSVVLLAPVYGIMGVVLATAGGFTAYWITEVVLYRRLKISVVEGLVSYFQFFLVTGVACYLIHCFFSNVFLAIAPYVFVVIGSSVVFLWSPSEIKKIKLRLVS